MKDYEKSRLLLSAQSALLFSVWKGLRYVSIEVLEEGVLDILVYVNAPVNSEQKDCVYSLASQIEGDFVDLNSSNVQIVASDKPYDDLKHLRCLVFAEVD